MRGDILARQALHLLAQTVALGDNLGIAVDRSEHTLDLCIALEELDGKVAGRELARHTAVALEQVDQGAHGTLDILSQGDVYMTHLLVTLLIYIDDGVEEVVDTLAVAGHHRHHRHAYHLPQGGIVESRARRAQLVVHIEGNHHRAVHVDKLGGEIEVALKI